MQPTRTAQFTGLATSERLVLLAGLSYVVMTVLSGPLRMALSVAGLSPLIYVPNLLLLLATAWQIVAEPRQRGFTAMNLVALVIPCYALAIGLQFVSVVQAAMGFYVLLPFWYGLSCGALVFRHWHAVARLVLPLWCVVVAGVLVNQFVEYPWEGFGYNLGELEVEGSRQWYATGGSKRIAGFARASFDAAVHVQLAGILLALQTKGRLSRLLVWSLTILAVLPTHSKGILMVAAVLTPVILLRGLLPESPLRALPALFGLVGIALPTSTLLFTFNSQLQNPTLANLTYSFYDRLNYMWPDAWALLGDRGQWLLGRGIGGIGTAQSYFEPALFNAGDNLFMYWFVVFGLAALPVYVLLLLKSFRIRPFRSADELRIYCLFMATLVYGTMTNIVENALSALVCGLLVRWLCSTTASPLRQPNRNRAGDAFIVTENAGDPHVRYV